MDKIVMVTKFNKTGKRILTPPLDDKKVFAPAYQWYKKARRMADNHWKAERNSARTKYVDTVACAIAEYVANDSTSCEERHNVTKFLATQLLTGGAPEGWARQLAVPALVEIGDRTWAVYVEACRQADLAHESTLRDAGLECSNMKHALLREVVNRFHKEPLSPSGPNH